MKTMGRFPAALIAGTAGTAALNISTYLDMTLRGRPSSTVPAQAAEKMAEGAGIDLARDGGDDTRDNRAQGLGALMGYGAGLGSALLYPVIGRMEKWPLPIQAAGVMSAAMMAGNLPAAGMGITDPSEWSASDWISDIVPHALYGLVTALAYQAIRRP